MGVMDWFRGGTDVDERVGLDEVLDKYELVSVSEDGYIVVAERNVELDEDVPSLTELGGGSSEYVKVFQEEYNHKLRGVLGVQKYMEMRTDARVRNSLKLAKTPVLAARWYVEPASNSELDEHIASFVWNNLDKWMGVSWYQFLHEALYMLDYGHYVFEKVFDVVNIDGQQRVVWKKLAPRHPVEVLEFIYDSRGGPEAIRMVANNRARNEVIIPIEKLLVFTYEQETGNLKGNSVLRSAYKHWFYKESLYKIDAIQKERHSIGIPVIVLPANYDDDDKKIADKLGQNLRTNEEAHVTLPPGWELHFAEIEGNAVDALESAKHHGDMIYDNVTANFVISRTADETDIMENTFHKASRYIGETIRGTMNKYAIPQLVDYNWNVEHYPNLRVRRLGETVDWRTISFAVRNFVGAGIIRPDDNLESWVRDEMDMPGADVDSVREIESPQQPQVGPPRQPTAAGQGTGSNTEAGSDRSGG